MSSWRGWARRSWIEFLVALALTITCAGTWAGAQALTRIATTADALLASAVFFHGRTVVLHQRVIEEGDLTRLADAPKPIYVFGKQRLAAWEGEVRGEFWDLGRTEQGDARFAGYDFSPLLERVTRGRWPGRDQIYVMLDATISPALPTPAPTLRAIALKPDQYVDREVRVIGRFKGRNLYGELPVALGEGKWDFVLQSAEGAMWVTGIRPRGKGFDLDPGKRVDTGRWLQVTGVVKRKGTATYIEASAVAEAAAPEDRAVEVQLPERPKAPPPEVSFSAPVGNDVDVERGGPIRIQFSSDMNAKTFTDRVKVTYVAEGGAPPATALPAYSVAYLDGPHAIEIRFAEPLAPFQTVRVDLLDGITALDGQPLKPWALTFTTGR